MLDQKSERNISMTDTNEHNTNAITYQTPEELSEQDMQAINGGGQPMSRIAAALEGDLGSSSSLSRHSSAREEPAPVLPPPPMAPAPDARSSVMEWAKRPATRGAAGSIAVGGVTAFGVGAVTG
jgi:hypothetical protein